MSHCTINRQAEHNRNVAEFLVRLKNFFRHPLAAADVPPGASWAARDAYDPWVDRFWR